ncbi:MAG: UxaA family hydrolase [Candidatus Caldatribacteriota bacterium]
MEKEVSGIIVNNKDNVCTLVEPASKGTIVNCRNAYDLKGEIKIRAKEDIPIFHKMAIKKIAINTEVIKYGQVIGIAKKDIYKGEYVHIHNVDSKRVQGDIIGN